MEREELLNKKKQQIQVKVFAVFVVYRRFKILLEKVMLSCNFRPESFSVGLFILFLASKALFTQELT
jgi:hypothetical protein